LDLVNQRYFGKLGLLNPIKEEDYSLFFEKSRSLDKIISSSSDNNEKKLSFNKIQDDFNIWKFKDYDKNTESDEFISLKMYSKDLESLLIKNIDKILKNYQNNSKIINDLGSGGWNILHFAIFCGHIDVVKRLMELLNL